MSGSVEKQVRELLRAAPDGLTHRQIAERTVNMDQTRVVLERMPDSYIDRWAESPPRCGSGPRYGVDGYEAVWCVVVPPDDCPHPTGAVK